MNSRNTLRWCIAALLAALAPGVARAQIAVPPPTLQPLNQSPIPEPPNLFQFVKNKPAAIRLGKAFFWDMQVGSDGVQACASCHFHAGADNRLKNTMNPGARAGDTIFQVRGPNQILQPADFPFHLRADPPDRQSSAVLRDSNDIVGSQGVTRMDFLGIVPGSAVDDGVSVPDPVFQVGGVNVRRVTARNTPSVINAVFNFNNFWDGRAHFQFNGVNPFGPLDTTAGIWVPLSGVLVKQPVAITFASLASQATGPPLDDTEMSFRGRTFPHLGRKLLSLVPLGQQLVHPNDSVLGTLSRATLSGGQTVGQNGLSMSYAQMIQDAFLDQYWSSPLTTPEGFSQMEANFSLFWGLAIQLYEATLVSDQTPFDRFLGGDTSALSAQAQEGFNLFEGAGCGGCHAGIETTSATVAASFYLNNTNNSLIEPMVSASGINNIYDLGYNNTAVRPTFEDIGRGAESPFPNPRTGRPFPLGFSALAELQARGLLGFDGTLFPAGSPLTPILPAQIPDNFPVGNDGAFKVPGLRNVELTAPYFHTGGDLTLDEVMDFYVRGANFPDVNADDLDPAIVQLGNMQGKPDRHSAVIAFMTALTDERVRNESAPFDHPELLVPNGHAADGSTEFVHLPAKGADGVPASTIAVTLDPVASPTRFTSQVIHGTHGPGATVAVSLNGGAPVPAAIGTGNTWSVELTGLVEGTNAIVVSASAAGSTTNVPADLLVDLTPPALAVGAIASPTALGQVTLTGTVEAGVVPTLAVLSSAVAGPVTVAGGSWSATVTGLADGVNGFVVTATDAAGNQAVRSGSVIHRLADGDLDGSGTVDVADALAALRISAGLEAPTAAELGRGDCAPLVGGLTTQSGALDVGDAVLILRKAAGLASY